MFNTDFAKKREVAIFGMKFRIMSKYLSIALVTIFIVLSSQDIVAQKKRRSDFYGHSNLNLLRTKVSRNALILTFGATNMFSFDERRAVVLENSPNQEYFFNSGGDWGAMAEIGMLHFTKRERWGFLKIDHFDWGLGVKNFRGWETTRLVTRENPNVEATGEDLNGTFSLGYLSGRVTFHNLIKLSPRIQLDNGFGANFDYRAFGDRRFDNSKYEPFALETTQNFQKDFIAQLHYEIGFRIRAINMVHITPMLHIPLISAYQWSGGRATIAWFSSDFQPWLLKFKIMFPKVEKQGKCPSVYSNPEDERRNKEYMEGK